MSLTPRSFSAHAQVVATVANESELAKLSWQQQGDEELNTVEAWQQRAHARRLWALQAVAQVRWCKPDPRLQMWAARERAYLHGQCPMSAARQWMTRTRRMTSTWQFELLECYGSHPFAFLSFLLHFLLYQTKASK